MSASPTVAHAVPHELGEGVLWDDRLQALWWTDIGGRKLWRLHPDDGRVLHWDMPERLASFALCEADGWLLLALASRLAFFHPDTRELIELHAVETASAIGRVASYSARCTSRRRAASRPSAASIGSTAI
jgi:L-arabinonolactonase